METAICPKASDYRHLLAGSLAAEEQQPLLSHLESCGSCAETVQSLLAADTFASTAQATKPYDESLPAGLIDTVLAIQAEDSLSGLTQIGPYRLRERLGQGGMGIVFLADDPHLERAVALKIMRPKLATSDSARQRFLREARSAAKVKSDHVVTIYQTGEEGGIAYVAMERLVGASLGERLAKESFSIPESLRIARQMALGLAAAHEQGLVHRDIKPENVWLESPVDRVKLLDFGLARPIDAEVFLTSAGAIVGTPAFMAPEQAAGSRVDARSDLFSLGSVLYRLVTGRQPFPGENVMAVLSALASTTPPAARSMNPLVPPRLDALITRLLAKDPAARPTSAKIVADELAAIEANPNQSLPWSRRKLLAMGVLPVLGVAGYFAVPRSQPAPPPPRRELRLTSKATAFVGNFNLDPARLLTVEGFVTLEESAFDPTGACQVMATNCLSIFGCGTTWSFGVRMLKKDGEPMAPRITGGETHQGRRVHIAALRLGPQLRLYLDGTIIGSENIGHDWKFIESSYFCLGGSGVPYRFDEVRISTIPRYTANFTPADRHEPDEHTFALYHLDETVGLVVTDSSGHGRHGNNHSGEWVEVPR